MKYLPTARLTFLMSTLLLLSACNWWGSKDAATGVSSSVANETILLSLDGKPVITVKEFETFYNQTLEQQPQLAQFAAFMPDLKENLYNTFASYKLLEYWIRDNKINQKPEYVSDRDMLIENIERSLALKYFQLQFPVDVRDADVKKYYEDNKETIYLMAPSGIAALGASFGSEKDAQAFFSKAKKADDFIALAKDDDVTVRNFGRVNEQSNNLDEGLKQNILGVSSFPSVQLFVVGDTHWVVQVKSKDEAKYYSFEQAEDDARTRIMAERSNDMLMKEIENLKSKYNVIENKTYFETQAQEQQPMPDMSSILSDEIDPSLLSHDDKSFSDELPVQKA
ncbi:peptidyl-prolyl cis-trans isomerase [Candidatus Babeliales bacterium]|nr:peptidyl-prolyl cis-trans isomerase [Candidatus Babeliales bacterium]